MFAAGFMPTQAVTGEPDFAAVLGDPRVASLLDEQKRAAEPCVFKNEFRSMDFWIGDWTVETAAGQPPRELVMSNLLWTNASFLRIGLAHTVYSERVSRTLIRLSKRVGSILH